MAKGSQKDILSRVQDLGEEALQKLSEVPGGSRIVDVANQTKSRLDDLQKRVRGLEGLEQRVAKLEQQVASLTKTSAPKSSPPKSSPPKSSTTRKTATEPKPATPKKPPA